jgi:NADPH2:quinone reductase
MRAITIDAPDAPPALREGLPRPTPADSQVLVRVRASSVNPVDNSIAGGLLAEMGVEHDYPVTLGRDYAGLVDQVGDAVSGYAVGDEVFGFLLHANPAVHDGSWAEFVLVNEDFSIAPVPARVELATAGAAALACITAVGAVDALNLSHGDVVMVAGATGGVGSLAVQLAFRLGATVVAPALAEDEEYVRGLGLSDLVPREGEVVAAVRDRYRDGVDALLDLVNYAPGTYDGALRDGARVASSTGAAGEGPGRTNVMAQPTRDNLERVAELVAGGLKVPVQETYAFDRDQDALQALATAHTQGKLAIRIS